MRGSKKYMKKFIYCFVSAVILSGVIKILSVVINVMSGHIYKKSLNSRFFDFLYGKIFDDDN